MEEVCEDDLCWLKLDDFRMLLIKNVDASRITPYLRQCQVISAEDEEELFNDPTLAVRRRKVGALLDILQRTGVKGYTAFLESLELDYPQLYSRITGKEPNKTFSILVDTAGESGLTQFLMSELSRLQRALQDERRRRQQACSVAKEQEVWSQQQQLKDRESRKLKERLHKIREERERLSEEVKQLRDHNYSLMADINSLSQERSNALLANRDLQIEVERLKHTVLRAESQTRLLRRRTMRPLQESRSLALPPETFFNPNPLEELKEEKPEEKKEEKHEVIREKQKETQQQMPQKSPALPSINLINTVFKLRKALHKAEEQSARRLEEKEELELLCAQLKGDARMYRQQNKQTLRQLEEVIKERDKALSSRAEHQEEARLLLQEKDQYREQVRQLTEQTDKLELSLLRTQGEELQLRTRLRRLTCNTNQSERSVSSEEEQPENVAKGSSEEVRSGTSGENEEAAVLQQYSSPPGGATQPEEKPCSAASLEEETDVSPTSMIRPNFFYRRLDDVMCESRAVPSGKVYRQLFEAQAQLSRSLLAGRRDTRTDCLSAEDSNTHFSATSRLLCPFSSWEQQVDGADEVDDVCRLPDSVVGASPSSNLVERLAEKKSKRHKETLTQLDKELTEITQVYETQVRTVSVELQSSLQDLDLCLSTLKERMKQPEHLEDITLQDVCGLWEEVEEVVKKKKTRIKELNQKLTEAENKRTDQIRVVLKKYCPLLERISFLPPPDVHRLIHNEAAMLNQSLLANRRSVARLLLHLQEENLQQESLLRLHWEDYLSRWKSSRATEIIDQYKSLCSSDQDQELVSVQQVIEKMKQTQQELAEKRLEIISNICSLVPPSCSTSVVSDWFNQLTAVNQQIDSFHADYLSQLQGCYEQRWRDRLAVVERCKEALSALQLSEEEVNHAVSSALLPLIGQRQSQDEEQLAALNVCRESVASHALGLSRRVFVMLRGVAVLWETHSSRLKMREDELQQHLDNLRDSQQQHTEKQTACLDIMLNALRQESREDALETSLDKAVVFLQEIQQSSKQCISDQCQQLDRLPSLLLEELLSYSSSLSSFYHLDHIYRPSPEELQNLHPSLTATSDQEASEGAEIKEPLEMTKDHSMSCQPDTDPSQPSKDWLTEAETSLKELCDISSNVSFTSSSGVAYSGPDFPCPAPPETPQQETHLILFPGEPLTNKLTSSRTLFLDNLEQHFQNVLRSAVTMVTHRKEVLHSEHEINLKQLNRQHIETHIYQPRLAELQLHSQCVDTHCEEVSTMLASCRMELQDLQTSISKKNQVFATKVSNMEDNIVRADNSQRLKAVSSALQDCLDNHIKDIQDCQTAFKQTIQKRLEEVRHKMTQLLSSFRLFSEGGDFAPQEVILFQRRLKEKTKEISAAEVSIYSQLEAFESKSSLQVKEVSGRLEETLSFLRSEVTFMEEIKKIISSTQVSIKAEAASSNQQQAAISSKLEDLKRMMESTQVSPEQVCSLLSSVSQELKKRSQYLEFSMDQTLLESLTARPKSTKRVRPALPPDLLQPSRKDVDLLSDPVVGIIKSLNRLGMVQDDATEVTEKKERGRTGFYSCCQSSVQRLHQRCTESVSNLSGCESVSRGSKSIRSGRRLQIFGPKPNPEQTTHSLISAVNSVLWKANDVILQVSKDFYRSKRGSRFLLVPDSLDQWTEKMQQRLLGYQEQAKKLLSTSREELGNQLSVLTKLLKLLPEVLISNHEQQQEAGLRETMGGVRTKLEEMLAASEEEKCENVHQLKVSLKDGDELQTLNSREDLRQKQLHSAVCSAHLELQESVRAKGEEFVTSLASLTEKLIHQLDELLTATDAPSSQQPPAESSVTMETGDETGLKLCTVSRTFSGIPYRTLPADSTADSPSNVTIATTASISTTRCTSVHMAVIERRDAAVKRFEQLLKSESSRSDDDKLRRLSEVERWSTDWRQQLDKLNDTHSSS
ncbi:hypothetical protein L3Q82_023465 [Xyrichtys novacula]|uniref:CARD domain-containing protein n=1 Tax=Xyrichtys novacula TaxID=13765 RepID=A0AAV1G9M7_XYRNO|nr:hypothetical protein L3Q82_023465 [Xyrichtys novacula]